MTEESVSKISAYPVIRGCIASPWAVMIYGPPGVGKSWWAAKAPKPFFIDLEDGLARIDCDRSPVVTSHKELIAAVQFAAGSDYQTIVFDTADALEKILTATVCQKHEKDSLADFVYGKGEIYLRSEWTKLINVFLRLKAKGKNVILTANEIIQKLDDPTTESYDRYTLNLDKRAAPAVTAALDAVFFARYETILKARDEDKNNSKVRAVGTGKRLLYTMESPSFVAKNRFGLPAQVPMTSAIFAKFGGLASKSEETKNEDITNEEID